MSQLSDKLIEKLKSGREYRNVAPGSITIRKRQDGEPEQSMIVEGYATTFGDEYTLYDYDSYCVMESIDARAFDEADMSDVIMQYNHEGRVFARRSNGTLEVRTDDHGLMIRADLSGTELGRSVYEEIRGEYTVSMSMGFAVATDTWTYEEDHETGRVTAHRVITGIKKLYDVSAVSLPANDATEISARSVGVGAIVRLQEELRERARKRKLLDLRLKLGGK